MARYLTKIVILGAQVVGRALMKTLRQELQAFEDAARMHETMTANSRDSSSSCGRVKGMTLEEAQQILNVKDLGDRQAIDSHYQHLFRANEKSSGGTFYIQSKVFRAKERIDQELARLAQLARATDSHPPAPFPSPCESQSQSQSQAKQPGQQSR
ncbi:mitochondrial import inner membrane translocase subunit TIM16 [Drosophila biarmipes]|uniref:mitochondrial import inner membrane translocase subunit TIM16 n=1 Tax=Drosophila biarmipes TaxID=125945 RepID=UPI0007E86219|nr:mitochondrial import inner membrane translocase subunit TIM16 [Drosophila biarmipes]